MSGNLPKWPVARFDDLRGGGSVQFSALDAQVVAHRPDQVYKALRTVQEAVDRGSWAFGYVAYEAAAGLDPSARVQEPHPGLPLVWFGVSAQPDPDTNQPSERGDRRVQDWTIDWSAAEHAERVARVRDAIAAGDTYQCNLTTRARTRISGDLFGYYLDLTLNQRGRYNAFLDLGRWVVLSASPECFFEWQGDTLVTMPMKGTAPRGAFSAADAEIRSQLRASVKERAENIMIVDLLRNDLARIARAGTVTVTDLLACEKYPTIWQLTSTVAAEPVTGTSLPEIFGSLFPCGSVTGAPKLATMDLIAQLETSPRGVYCGAVGYVAPGSRPHARFNVAIRTVLVDRLDNSAIYGVGGGVTWSSTAEGEYVELVGKTRVLMLNSAPEFSLLEALVVVDGRPQHLTYHLDRLADSADYFDFAFDRAAIQAAAGTIHNTRLLRVQLNRDGTFAVEPRPLEPFDPTPLMVAIDQVPIDPQSPYVYHKTTIQDHFTLARKRHPSADDVVLVNPAGHVTQTTTANLAVRIRASWYTPPLADGCLPGVRRRLLLERQALAERPITVAELESADEIAVISSTRGWHPAILIGADRG